jgi:post-segregation antitoxin (ccd killing protein)
MAFDPVLTGATANDGTGDPLRTAFTRINDNFDLAVEGAASSTDGTVVQFDGTTGKVVKASSVPVADIIVEGDARLTDSRTPTAHGNEAHTSTFVDAAGAAAAAPVQSVNTLTGAVVLDAAAVGAYPDTNPNNYIDSAGAPVQSVNSATGTVTLDSDDIAEGTTNLYNRVPTGGTTGQVLAKASGTDYDAAWSPTALVDGAARPLNTAGAHLDGTKLVLNSIAGNRAESPHAAVLNLTGDLDIRMLMRPRTAWNSVSWATINKRAVYGLSHSFVSVNGQLTLQLRVGGVNVSKSSTVAASANLGTTPSIAWVRGTVDVDNGAGGHDVTFFTSTDGINWTQLGTVVTTAGTITIDTSTNELQVGDLTGFVTVFSNADIYRAQIRDGIDGTVIFDADFAAQTADALAFTESSTNAATVSITTTRYTVGIPNSGFMSIGTQAIAANTDYFEPFTLTASTVVDLLTFEVTTAPSSTATVHGAIYAATSDYQPTGAPLAAFGGVSVATSVAAVYSEQITPVTLPPGAYVLAFNSSVAFTARSMRRPDALIHTLGANPILATTTRARTNAAFPTPSAGWSERTASSTGKNTFAVLRWRPA